MEKRVVAFVVLFIFILFGYIGHRMTGNTISTGTVNLTVDTISSVNFTISDIDWGSGAFDDGAGYALLVSNGTVENGNWTPVSDGFVIENNGNVGLIFNLSFGKNASELIGGSGPEYLFKVSDVESGSCTPASGFNLDQWYNISTESVSICSNFNSTDLNDLIKIDLYLKIPSNSKSGSLNDTLTASYEVI